ncbi:MAG TPA: Rne/Rng family ribonuclease [Candidatus Solibacter sp.]|nr:Rne/Rng family ribonuclease [Candidatus Solibacter sp.]
MNKELFVSSTPHETKVGLVEDDLLAEVYLERENEYTLAGSIYKGRVTRVLPGMQSAFVDIGLERDAFLYVSDFMELEEHDDDLTDVVPANRGVQDLRPQPVRAEGSPVEADTAAINDEGQGETSEETGAFSADAGEQAPQAMAAAAPESTNGADRDRGNWRGRRRRRGGRRDGREGRDGRESRDRGSESRYSRGPESSTARTQDFTRSQPSGPPPGYTPILLPGESLSKYRRTQPSGFEPTATPSYVEDETAKAPLDDVAPVNSAFPDDEPMFAAAESVAEPLHEEHDHTHAGTYEPAESASTTADWNQEFRRAQDAPPVAAWEPEATSVETSQADGGQDIEEHEVDEESQAEPHSFEAEHSPAHISIKEEQIPVFAAPGTMEEETIEEEEADTIRYESSSDEGYEEFEEETQSAGPAHLNGDARETVAEIHQSSMVESGTGDSGEAHAPEAAAAEDDSEELELEEAQAEAEAMLDAEARGNGIVDARAEVRGPSGTAGYTQRTQRSGRPGYERRDRRRGGGARRFRRRESAPVPLISDLLKEGQEILVQIAKEPIGKKGARITSHIALPGRFLVYMPTVNHTGVSRKISSEEERQRLKRIILSERENGHGGFIVRTAAQSASEDELRADIRFLKGLWQDIKNRAESSKPPALIYHDLNVVERVLRDQVTSDFNVIWVDTEPEYERVLRFFNRFQPALVKRVKLYTKETPLFEQFGLAEEMNKALKSKVWLKSGGYIVINQTEALVAIDINTGKYVGKTARLEDTIVKTNIDAVKEIVRQVRLRDLGGIIIIDFIDMDERRNRQRVMQALEEELRHDRAPSKTLQFNDFGLVAITRKRVKQSLERTIGAPCPYCQSTGYVKSVNTVCNEIYVEMRKIAKHLEHEDVMLRVHPDVAKELKAGNARLLNEMEELTKRTIIVKSDPAVHQEQFDIN